MFVLSFPALKDGVCRASDQNFRVLLDFSLGRNDVRTTMHTLSIDTEEDLFLLMAQAHLPMPRLPALQTHAMVNDLTSLLKQ
ncbi:MAG: hypothetical protein ACRYHA_24565 [Janthinobacterium lividum]